jgi:hypothetical protein
LPHCQRFFITESALKAIMESASPASACLLLLLSVLLQLLVLVLLPLMVLLLVCLLPAPLASLLLLTPWLEASPPLVSPLHRSLHLICLLGPEVKLVRKCSMVCSCCIVYHANQHAVSPQTSDHGTFARTDGLASSSMFVLLAHAACTLNTWWRTFL